MTENPFFEPSTLVYELPPFAEIRQEHYLPAFERGMADQLAEIAAITAGPQAPTFDNTLVALERSGALLRRVGAVFHNQSSADTDDALDALDAEISPGSPPTGTPSTWTARSSPGSRPCTSAARHSAWTRRRCGCSSATTPASCGPAPGSAPPSRPGCAS